MNTYQSNFNVIYYDIRLFEHFDFSQNTVQTTDKRILLLGFCHSVRKSQKKSHSTLQVKRATFTI